MIFAKAVAITQIANHFTAAGSFERIFFAASTPDAMRSSVTGHEPLRMPILCSSR
jgi:hypothetical protein